MITSPTEDDDAKRHLSKKKELNLQPISSPAPAPSITSDEDVQAIMDRVSNIHEDKETTSEESVRQQSLVLPQQQDAAFLINEKSVAKKEHNTAALNIVRSKLAKIYKDEPDADEEAVESFQAGDGRSKHQQYMLELTNSGKSLAAIQIEWHAYYASLPDNEKHEVWQEFYNAHSAQAQPAQQISQSHIVNERLEDKSWNKNDKNDMRTVAEIKHQLMRKVAPKGVKLTAKHHIQSLLFGLGMASLVVVLLLFSFFNERFIAPFISPSHQVSATPIIGISGDIGPDQEIIIPKINLEIPVIYGTDSNNEQAVEDSLQDGVVHYSTSALPGQTGNVVIVGHSSNNILNKGKYKFAFVLLKRLEVGDTFSLNKGGVRYTYQVFDKKIVKPTDVSVLGPTSKANSATLITCDPPGTSLNRLVVVGEQISPDPSTNAVVQTQAPVLTSKGILPGNSTSLWQKVKNWF